MLRNTGIILLILIGFSCSVSRNPGLIPEDNLFVTRKYVGNLTGCKVRPPDNMGNPYIIDIKTTMDTVYGTISAYSRDCGFESGDRLYVRRIYQHSGVFGSWIYQIESDGSGSPAYKISEFRQGEKILVQNWF